MSVMFVLFFIGDDIIFVCKFFLNSFTQLTQCDIVSTNLSKLSLCLKFVISDFFRFCILINKKQIRFWRQIYTSYFTGYHKHYNECFFHFTMSFPYFTF